MSSRASALLAAVVIAGGPAVALAADTWVIDKAHSEASFQIRHLMSKVRGHFNDYAGTVTVDAAPTRSRPVKWSSP